MATIAKQSLGLVSSFALAVCLSTACVVDVVDEEAAMEETPETGALPSITGHYIEIGSTTTWLKKTTAQSTTLELASEKCRLYAGSVVPIQQAPQASGNHYLINTRRIIPGCGFSKGYVYIPHVAAASGTGGGGGGGGGSSDGALLRPVPGPISSYYGPRGSGFHYGLDIADYTGTPVMNPAGGTLLTRGYAGGCGYSFEVSHAGGLDSRYCHLSALAGVVGRYYSRGTVLGRVGSTGNSTGPHLHVELYQNGQIRDPLSIAPYWR
jgi:murein DD-endopeptidase MepM/ murein hydrolase activator NlpD